MVLPSTIQGNRINATSISFSRWNTSRFVQVHFGCNRFICVILRMIFTSSDSQLETSIGFRSLSGSVKQNNLTFAVRTLKGSLQSFLGISSYGMTLKLTLFLMTRELEPRKSLENMEPTDHLGRIKGDASSLFAFAFPEVLDDHLQQCGVNNGPHFRHQLAANGNVSQLSSASR